MKPVSLRSAIAIATMALLSSTAMVHAQQTSPANAALDCTADTAPVAELGAALLDEATTAGDRAAYLACLDDLADSGDSVAMIALGDVYRRGVTGIVMDAPRALTLYQAALDAGNLQAQSKLGAMYLNGEGVSADAARGTELLAAAAQRNPNLFVVIANAYTQGQAFPADGVKASEYFEIAADAGIASGLTGLGDLYRNGAPGIEPDAARAYGLFERALAAGDRSAQSRMGSMLLNGQGVEADPERGIALLEDAASRNANLYAVLANIFVQGQAVPANGAKAAEYFQRAADAGIASGLTGLGDLYRNGAPGIEADTAKAYGLFEQALAAGDTAAQSRIGSMLLNGQGVEADPARGIALIEEAASRNANLYAVLANIFMQGQAVPADGLRAADYFQKAADAGVPSGLTGLANLFRNGAPGIQADPGVAYGLFEQALAAGDTAAQSSIGSMLLNGQGVEADPERGIAMIEDAASRNANLYVVLANVFVQGRAVPADGTKAADYFQKAADAGIASGLTGLADLYRAGAPGISADPTRAFGLFEQALAAGDTAAQSRIGSMLLNGQGVAADPERGIALLEEAAQRNAYTYLSLAAAYRQGKAVRASNDRALAYWREAADAGVEQGLVEIVSFRATNTPFAQLEEDFATLSTKGRADTLAQLRWRAPNAYVYFVQSALAEQGLYDGSLSGLLTQSTIRAIYAACGVAGTLDQCREGPLGSDGWRGLRTALYPDLT